MSGTSRDRFVLGVNAYHADAAAVLLDEGRVVCAIAEERVNRKKHFAGLPVEAARTCLRAAGIRVEDVGHVAIARDPAAARWRKLAYLAARPHRAAGLAFPRLANRAHVASVPDALWSALGGGGPASWRMHRVEHHLAHAASAFLPSPFERAAILTVDGFGDFSSTLLGEGEGGAIRVLSRVHFPHSLGVLYTAVSQFIGFDRYGDEGKVMGLAPYGEVRYRSDFDEVLRVNGDGRFALALPWFLHHRDGSTYGVSENGEPLVAPLWSERMADRFGPPRARGTPITDRERDLARSLQDACERAVLALARAVVERTGCRDLCLAGGVALNSVANGRVVLDGVADRAFVQAAATDDGTALGAALFVATQRLGAPRWRMEEALLGPGWTEAECLRALQAESGSLSWTRWEDDPLVEAVADDLAAGRIVGWFQGREEWGPRALGSRSILADPRAPDMKERLNARVKHREAFRPFAPSVLAEASGEVFESGHPSPFMAHVFPVRPAWRSRIPAVTHVDGTGRLQTVAKESHPRYHRLIDAFRSRTGVPVVLNTSFNDDEPIVHRPEEAVACFLRTDMDRLAIGPFYVRQRGASA